MDRERLRQLYDRYARELYLYLYGLCRSRTQAEDLVQETFLKALLALPDGHPNLRAWLYLVGRNLFYDQQRKEQRLTLLEAEPPDSTEPPEVQLFADEQKSALYRLLGQLEPKKREILLLQYFGGLTHREIAAMLRLTPEYVRVLAGRGRRELKQRMEELGYDL